MSYYLKRKNEHLSQEVKYKHESSDIIYREFLRKRIHRYQQKNGVAPIELVNELQLLDNSTDLKEQQNIDIEPMEIDCEHIEYPVNNEIDSDFELNYGITEKDKKLFEENNPTVGLEKLYEAMVAELVFSQNLTATSGDKLLNAFKGLLFSTTGKELKLKTFETISNNILNSVNIRVYYYFICLNEKCSSENKVHGPYLKNPGPPKDEQVHCEGFNVKYHLQQKSYFMKISIEDQLKLIMKLYSNEIFEFKKSMSEKNELTSICNSRIYKKLAMEEDVITLSLCTDEVRLDQAHSINCLAILFYVNELPNHLRKKLPIYSIIFASEKKLEQSNILFDPVCDELVYLWNEGITMDNGKHIKSIKHLSTIADAPMRSYILCIQACTSLTGCPWCWHKCERMCDPDDKKKMKKFPNYCHISIIENNEILRSNSDYENISKMPNPSSIKNKSSFCQMPPEHNINETLSVDSMHCIALGIVKYWLNNVWFTNSPVLGMSTFYL